MIAITTKYLGPTTYKPARYRAMAPDGQTLILTEMQCGDHERYEENHRAVSEALCKKHGWNGHLIGGGLRNGMVWVFANSPD